jgi:cytochrome P450 family 2 subfamily B
MLYGTETIKEALVDHSDAFSGRGAIAVIQPIVQDYGEIWDRLKRRMWPRKGNLRGGI